MVTEVMVRIGELAERSGVSVRSLRYYEEQGLLEAHRSGSGQRHYRESAIDRVRLIRMLHAAGLSSRTIAELLPYVEARATTPESRARLRAERDRIDAEIAALTLTRDRLDALILTSAHPASGCTWIAEPSAKASAGAAM